MLNVFDIRLTNQGKGHEHTRMSDNKRRLCTFM